MRVGRSPALLLMRERNGYTRCRRRRGMAACSPVLHSSRGLCLTMSAHTERQREAWGGAACIRTSLQQYNGREGDGGWSVCSCVQHEPQRGLRAMCVAVTSE